MKPRIGFVLEQGLGHVAYGMSLRRALADRGDMECVWLEVSFVKNGLGRVPLIGHSYALRGNLRARRAIGVAHREHPLDALFVHTSMLALLSGDYLSRIPTLLSLDATPLNYDELATWYDHKISHPLVERAKLLAHRALMRRAREITTWSEWAKESLVRDYGVAARSVTVVPPGTTIANFPERAAKRPRREGPMRVLFVGGDFRRKGGDLLLRVCREQLRSKVELHLVTGADVQSEDNVFVHRNVKPHSPELLKLYAEADVFALPTRGDCLAVVLGEAMAAGLPIVTTHVGAHAEAVQDGESGYVLTVDDADGLRDRLDRLASDPGLRERMGERSRRLGEERFDMHKNANRIADILLGLTRESAASGRN
jgi:glycosyltransferase involved in cell wall biosynthesis